MHDGWWGRPLVSAVGVVIDGGTVSPGESPGALAITGKYHQLPGSLLALEIGGTIAGTNYDQLLVTGDVLVESDVRIAFINDFLPSVGDEFDLVGASTFDLVGQVIFLNAPPNFQYSTSFADGAFTVTINVVPEPVTRVLCWIGLALSTRVGRRGSRVGYVG